MPSIVTTGADTLVSISIEAPTGSEVFYTTDGTLPTSGKTKYNKPFTISKNVKLMAMANRAIQSSSFITNQTVLVNNIKKLDIKHLPDTSGKPVAALFDLKPGNTGANKSWINFKNVDLDIALEFYKPLNYKTIGLSCQHDWWNRGFLPEEIAIEVSADGTTFTALAPISTALDQHYWQIFTTRLTTPNILKNVKYLRIYAKNPGRYPKWFDWSLTDVNMFIDEIILEE